MKKKEYNVLSPDGFPIERDAVYSDLMAVKLAINRFVSRYEKQGYYSAVKGRIPLDEIEQNCKVIKY